MAFTNHAFCWTGIISTDPDAAGAFYAHTLGWDLATHTFDNGDIATMAVVNGIPRAHIRAAEGGEPSHWMPYLRVDIVDTAASKAVANGGQIVVPPMDIPPGRFSVVRSPTGAAFALFHEQSEADTNDAPQDKGGVCWTELHSTEIDADLGWLQKTFGYDLGEMPIPNGTYHLLKSKGADRAGAMAAQFDGVPSMWLTWIEVGNVDDTVSKVTEHGGTILAEPMEMEGVGRMAIAQDPTGGTFGVITSPQ